MKIIVDKMPQTCKDCRFKAKAFMRSPLGVTKEIDLCTIQATLTPPTEINQEPTILDLDKTPEENNCICKAIDDKCTALESGL